MFKSLLTFSKKKIDTQKIKNFNNALKVVEDFVLLEDFEKASLALKEIRSKEDESFRKYIETIEEKDKKKEIDLFKSKISRIDTLKEKVEKKKQEYDNNIRKKKKTLEKKNIENLIKEAIWKKDFIKAWQLATDYLEKNQDNLEVINYVNKIKKELLKLTEKEKKKQEKEIKKDALLEAKQLIWEIQYDVNEGKTKEKKNFFTSLKSKFNIRKKLKEKRLFDEITILLQAQNAKSDLEAKAKLEQVHLWLSKEIEWEKINWYDIYWKIMWADKISWDALWFWKNSKWYNFFIWDATWHWVRAWIIVSNLTKKFNETSKKLDIKNIVLEINNSLKQDLKSWNFITSIFFSINKEDTQKVEIVWMWHEPLFVYRKNKKIVEKIIPWWLAAWIRIIKDTSSIKEKEIFLEDWDIILSYTDWIVEAKSEDWVMYSIDRVWEKFLELARNEKSDLKTIYNLFVEDLKKFAKKSNFNDDVTILLVKKDKNKEILEKQEQIEEVMIKEWLYKNYRKKIKWKTLEEIQEDIKKIQKENAVKWVIKNLEALYKSWEMSKLKQDSIKYIKEWYIHSKINYYLKKALENENIFKIKQKNKKIQDKYNILKELYKKWDYQTVINECSNIISKDWNI